MANVKITVCHGPGWVMEPWLGVGRDWRKDRHMYNRGGIRWEFLNLPQPETPPSLLCAAQGRGWLVSGGLWRWALPGCKQLGGRSCHCWSLLTSLRFRLPRKALAFLLSGGHMGNGLANFLQFQGLGALGVALTLPALHIHWGLHSLRALSTTPYNKQSSTNHQNSGLS